MGDKTESPSQRKLDDARERGQVVKSTELAGALDLSLMVVLVVGFGSVMMSAIGRLMRRTLEEGAGGEALSDGAAGTLVRDATFEAGVAALPFMGAAVVIAALAHMVQTGPMWSTQSVKLDWSRLDPLKGLGRIVGLRNTVKTGLSTFKLVLVVIVATILLHRDTAMVAELPSLAVLDGLRMIGKMMIELAAWILALLLSLGVADYMYQRWQHTKDLRMTKQEVRDEHKSTDGDPQVKSRRQKIMRQIALNRARSAVPKADVIVTNPTHFSVAIKYDSGKMKAPRVVAKGVDHMAMQIREIAGAHGVPILERPPLARALYYGVEVGQDIPPEQYQAVAEVLAFVYRSTRKVAA
jgi:flagellar biosynthetic protein FlhB